VFLKLGLGKGLVTIGKRCNDLLRIPRKETLDESLILVVDRVVQLLPDGRTQQSLVCKERNAGQPCGGVVGDRKHLLLKGLGRRARVKSGAIDSS